LKFGPVDAASSEGAILAHAIRRPGLALKKGEILAARHIAALEAAGIETVIAARMEPGDVHEDEAARLLAANLAGAHVTMESPFTGRCNLFSATAGLVTISREIVDAINAVDEAVTVATIMPFQPVAAGEMIATVKIIPFAVPSGILARALAAARPGTVGVAPFRPLRVGAISTLLPGLKPAVVAKTLGVLQARLAPACATIAAERRVPHETQALSTAIAQMAGEVDLVMVFGASAITDRRDVIPAALVAAGGRVLHLGMPVDPGNLLLLGELGAIPVIGAPGCSRSPRENGFDFVLRRLLAGLPVTGVDLRAMGAGGLLKEIASRPQPRNPQNAGS
jgi:molybdenum cofactor cytidylyltransferase